MTVRLITVPMEGIGELMCKDCDYKRAYDEDDQDKGHESQCWCAAFKLWIPNDENDMAERLEICLESEVKPPFA